MPQYTYVRVESFANKNQENMISSTSMPAAGWLRTIDIISTGVIYDCMVVS